MGTQASGLGHVWEKDTARGPTRRGSTSVVGWHSTARHIVWDTGESRLATVLMFISVILTGVYDASSLILDGDRKQGFILDTRREVIP